MNQTCFFFGNSTCGKSAIINGITGQVLCKSGFSFTKITSRSEIVYHEDQTYIDTTSMDLDNNEKNYKSIIDITNVCLKYNKHNNCKIIFVFNVKNHEIDILDIVALKIILDSISITTYGIIFNRATKQFSEKFTEVVTRENILKNLRKIIPNLTEYFYLQEIDNKLYESDSVEWYSESLNDFIKSIPNTTMTVLNVISNEYLEELCNIEIKLLKASLL